jgi:hypothetical protein
MLYFKPQLLNPTVISFVLAVDNRTLAERLR